MRRTLINAGCLAAATIMAGCTASSSGKGDGGILQQLGLRAGAPDEFLIISRKPLQMPASFDLPRPQPGQKSPLDPDPNAEAHLALFSRPEPVRLPAPSQGETVLLTGAGATADNASIREVVDGEDPLNGERQFGLTSLFGIDIPGTIADRDAVLKSPEEVERLRQLGLRTPAAPPVVEEKKSIFGIGNTGADE